MTHLDEEQLVLHYYGEDETPEAAAHLAGCDTCRAEFQELRRTLDSFDAFRPPERLEDYGAEVWRRIRPLCVPPRRAPVIDFRRWAVIGAIAAMLVLEFYAGRFSNQPVRPTVAGIPGQVRERILLVAVGEHLERSQMVLAELVNAPAQAELDITNERERARDLVSESRLYRQTSSDPQFSGLLEELERVLLEIAHSPSRIPPPELDRIRQRIETEGILFKIRVVGSTIREKASVNKGAI